MRIIMRSGETMYVWPSTVTRRYESSTATCWSSKTATAHARFRSAFRVDHSDRGVVTDIARPTAQVATRPGLPAALTGMPLSSQASNSRKLSTELGSIKRGYLLNRDASSASCRPSRSGLFVRPSMVVYSSSVKNGCGRPQRPCAEHHNGDPDERQLQHES